MDWWLLSFFLGAILSLFLPIVPDLFPLFLLLILSFIFFYYSSLYKSLRLGSGLLLGACWMLFNAYNFNSLWQENDLAALELAAKVQTLQGQVLTLQPSVMQVDQSHINKNPIDKNIKDKRLRFNFSVSHINANKLNTAMTIRLSWRHADFNVQQGQVLTLQAKFKPAHGLANLGGFSYKTWLNAKSIIATGYVVKSKKNKILVNRVTIRQQLFNSYHKLLPAHELTPLLLALGFGSRSDLTGDLWQVLQSTGTGHLIAISGLHIGLVASGSYLIFMLLIRVLPLRYFAQHKPIQTLNLRYFAIALSMLIAFSYGYLAGFSLPTIRALVMLSLYWLTRLLAIKLSITRWLLLTLFVLTLISPFSLFTASFWLSVYAVTIIFLTLWRFKLYLSQGNVCWRFIKGLVVIQLSLTLMLLPVTAIFFQQIPVLSLLANILAVPWMSFISIPLCLLSVLVMPVSELLAQFLMMLCLESLHLIWSYLHFLSTQSWAIVELSKLNVLLLTLSGLCCFWLLFVKPNFTFSHKHSWLTILSMVVSVSLFSFTSFKGAIDDQKKWQLIVFDVGQGLSVLIKRGDHAVLYDTGAAYPSGFNMIEAAVLPYLQYVGITHLDKVIISHSDNDHAGGLVTLQASITVDELIYNQGKENNGSTCRQGDDFNWQGLSFKVLWPEAMLDKDQGKGSNKVKKQGNDDSCVLLISDGSHKILLTGDISKKVEAKLLTQYPELRADILIVPHHGSKTSSSSAFLQQLSVDTAIVSAGFLNRWHMPVSDVVSRYQQHNIALLNSANSGQIVVNFSAQGFVIQTYRHDLWPFWFAN